MTRLRWILATLVLALMAGLPATALGQDLTMVWEFKVKPGANVAFEQAVKAHMEYREAIGDPWEWTFYQKAIGKDVGGYLVRSSGHSWADFDEYMGSDFAQLAGNHFDATVYPLVDEVWNLVDQENGELSRYPEDMAPYTLFNVTIFYLKPDQMMAFSEAIGKFRQVIIDHDFPFYWSIQSAAAGADGPAMAFVGFAQDWAEMAEDPAVEQAMLEDLGEEGAMELMQQFSGAYHYFENYIGVARPDLTGGGGM
ncbi:MAG: hypothetical protein PVJ76_04995 [Gemmatimonadota bacterium]|jgi:hypothetical protein